MKKIMIVLISLFAGLFGINNVYAIENISTNNLTEVDVIKHDSSGKELQNFKFVVKEQDAEVQKNINEVANMFSGMTEYTEEQYKKDFDADNNIAESFFYDSSIKFVYNGGTTITVKLGGYNDKQNNAEVVNFSTDSDKYYLIPYIGNTNFEDTILDLLNLKLNLTYVDGMKYTYDYWIGNDNHNKKVKKEVTNKETLNKILKYYNKDNLIYTHNFYGDGVGGVFIPYEIFEYNNKKVKLWGGFILEETNDNFILGKYSKKEGIKNNELKKILGIDKEKETAEYLKQFETEDPNNKTNPNTGSFIEIGLISSGLLVAGSVIYLSRKKHFIKL